MNEQSTTTYALTPSERAVLTQYYGAVAIAKARMFDLQVETNKASKELSEAEARLAGSLTSTASAHGLNNAVVSADFMTISA